MSALYDRRRARREADRQRALSGETLAQFHARENAKPPTAAEISAPALFDFPDEKEAA